MLSRRVLLSAMVVCVVSCSQEAPDAATKGDGPENAVYRLDRDTIRLTGGEYRQRYDEGSATIRVVLLSDFVAHGDLYGDGTEDAAVILIDDPGGSGTFYWLAALSRREGGYDNVATEFLGDRIRIESLRIDSAEREIVVELLTRPEGVAMAEAPTVPERRRYVIAGGSLVAVDEEGP